MRRDEIDALLRERADHALRQTRLVVDHYRIRRKLALPLPVRSLYGHQLPMPFEGVAYPWSVWLAWALEERLQRLGWAGCWLNDAKAAERAEAELTVLGHWPRYDQLAKPDLAFAHTLRTMRTAMQHWTWLGEHTRELLRMACYRAIAQHVDWFDHDNPGCVGGEQRGDQRGSPQPMHHNITLIGTLAMATTARHIAHPQAEALHQQAKAAIAHVLDRRADGFSEAVGYDGYVLDFLADWLNGESQAVRDVVLEHPQFAGWMRQSLLLGAPGAPLEVAPIGDVEPREMVFHATGLAKVARLHEGLGASARWLLARADLNWLRSDTLAVMRELPDGPTNVPPCGAVDAHYATVLRSGYEASDVAVVASSTRSEMSHLPPDAGTLVIGTAGKWLIDDPGYQQYLNTSEREYTIGVAAHNGPVIAGQPPTQRGGASVLKRESIDAQTHHAAIDITAGYELAALQQAVRHLWLIDGRGILVGDAITFTDASPRHLTWHWHGHPDVAWWMRDNRALLYVDTPDALSLWITAPQLTLDETMLERQRGSRGQLTLSVTRTLQRSHSITWWLFELADAKEGPTSAIELHDSRCCWLGRTFEPTQAGAPVG